MALQSPQGARIVASQSSRSIRKNTMLQSPQGARIVAKKNQNSNLDFMLQSPQGARIVATIMLEYSAKGIYFLVISTRYSISYSIL